MASMLFFNKKGENTMCDSDTRHYNKARRLEEEFLAGIQKPPQDAAWICGDILSLKPEFKANCTRLPKQIEVVALGTAIEFRVVEGTVQYRPGEYFMVRTGQVQEMYIKSPAGPA